MANKVRKAKFISRQFVQSNRDLIFLFGDNLARKGFLGQAAEMRGEPNAIGIPTKHFPGRRPESYFTDEDFDSVVTEIDAAFASIPDGAQVVVPAAGIGGGLAELPTRAPKIYAYIEERILGLEEQ